MPVRSFQRILFGFALVLALPAIGIAQLQPEGSFVQEEVDPPAWDVEGFPTPVVPINDEGQADPIRGVATFTFAVDTNGELTFLLNQDQWGQRRSVTAEEEVTVSLDAVTDELDDQSNTFTVEFHTELQLQQETRPAPAATTTYTVYVDTVPPEAPRVIRSAGADRAILVEWERPPIPDFEVFDHFIVHYSRDNISGMDDETALALTSETSRRREARITDLQNGVTYYATVRSVDWVGNESDFPRDDDGNIVVTSTMPVTTVTMAELAGEEGGCFIATAAYGSYQAPHVRVLREFRDEILLESGIGRSFVDAYYAASPRAATWLAEHDGLRALVRVVLLPVTALAWLALHPAAGVPALLLLLGLTGTAVALRLRMQTTEKLG